MSEHMTEDPWGVVVERIGQLIHRHGSLRGCARVLDIDPGYLSRLFSGAKKDPSDKLLYKMGLQRDVTYSRRAGVR